MCRLLLFSSCNRSKQNAKVIGNRVGTYFFLSCMEVTISFCSKKIKWFLQKDLKLGWTFVRMSHACRLAVLVSN